MLRTSQSTHKVPVVSLCRGCLQVKQDAVSAERELVHKGCQEVSGVCVGIWGLSLRVVAMVRSSYRTFLFMVCSQHSVRKSKDDPPAVNTTKSK